MQDAEKLVQQYRERELKENDTFQFDCAMCGNCCRKRLEAIMITGPDLFYIAKALSISPEEAASQCTVWKRGEYTHLPVLFLRERQDGSCRLLRNGRCMVQQSKPVVCALFPIGRFFDPETSQFHYFPNRLCDTARKGPAGKTWTLGEWLDKFNLRNSEDEMRVWYRLMDGLSQVTSHIDITDISGLLLDILFAACYFRYDTTLPYIPQVEMHIQIAKEMLPKKFPIPEGMRLFE